MAGKLPFNPRDPFGKVRPIADLTLTCLPPVLSFQFRSDIRENRSPPETYGRNKIPKVFDFRGGACRSATNQPPKSNYGGSADLLPYVRSPRDDGPPYWTCKMRRRTTVSTRLNCLVPASEPHMPARCKARRSGPVQNPSASAWRTISPMMCSPSVRLPFSMSTSIDGP